MRIAYICTSFLEELFILNRITGLIDRGHDVDIYAAEKKNISGWHPDIIKYNLFEKTFLFEREKRSAFYYLKTIRFLLYSFYKKPSALFLILNIIKKRQVSSFFSAATLIKDKGPYDIIHCNYGPNGIMALMLKEITGLKGTLVTSFHGYDISKYIHKHGENVYDRLFKKSKLLLVVSNEIKKRLIELGCDKKNIVLHYSGIDTTKISFNPPALREGKKVRIISVGHFIEKKGFEYALHAVAKLRKDGYRFSYTIIGSGRLGLKYIDLTKKLGIENEVIFHDPVPNSKIIHFLENSDILLTPSVTARGGNKEGIPNIIKEAMAVGLPVISTFYGGIPELVRDGVSGFLVSERDPEALYEKLSFLIQNPKKWFEMGKAGRTTVENNFNIHKLNDSLVNIYEQLLES